MGTAPSNDNALSASHKRLQFTALLTNLVGGDADIKLSVLQRALAKERALVLAARELKHTQLWVPALELVAPACSKALASLLALPCLWGEAGCIDTARTGRCARGARRAAGA